MVAAPVKAAGEREGRVAMVVVAETRAGEEVRLVGSLPEVGAWSPERGVRLRAVSDDGLGRTSLWAALVRLPAADGADAGTLSYKFVVTGPSSARWEEGPNRQLRLASPGFVLACFGAPSEALAQAVCPRPAKPLQLPGHLVVWEAHCTATQPGDRLCVVGSAPELGPWEPRAGLELHTSAEAFPVWRGGVRLAGDGDRAVSWKLAVCRADGRVDWEQGFDRVLELPPGEPESGICVLRTRFGNTGVGFDMAVHGLAETVPHVGGRKQEERGDGAACLPPLRAVPSTLSTCSTGLDLECEEPISRHCTPGLDSPGWDLSPREETGPFLWSEGHCIAKSSGLCEDAYFAGSSSLGVADGVGSMIQFKKHGVNCAAYAQELMDVASKALQGPRSPTQQSMAADAHAAAAVEAAEKEASSFGASTVTVLQLENGRIGVANLGDSGFMVIRKGEHGRLEVVARSEEQQHSFNFPYQLMRLPSSLLSRLPPDSRADSAGDCERYQCEVRAGDLILAFTDGFSDNVGDREALDIVENLLQEQEGAAAAKRPPPGSRIGAACAQQPRPRLVAERLARAAQEKWLDPQAVVPFVESARRHGYELPLGGKEDDVTVVAAWVMPRAHAALAGA